MVRRRTFVALFLLPFVLGACTIFLKEEVAEPVKENGEQSSSVLPPEELVTRNVLYTGLLEQGGITIYQQGTHRLTLSDGKMVLLEPAEGSSLALNLYEGKLVRLRGDVMPTVEAGGTLMQVKGIEWIRRERDEEGKEVEVMRVLCGVGTPCPVGYYCRLEETGGICIEEPTSPSEAEFIPPALRSLGEGGSLSRDRPGESEETEDEQSAKPDVAAEEEPAAGDKEADRQVAAMMEEDLSSNRWTQQYCSAHIAFCIPVHKNWYYKSFGATSSVLWHVEVGAQTVENLGDGQITVDLKAGDLSALSVTDGTVSETDGKVIGYRAWSDNRHFEIATDASLKDAVTYLTKGLNPSE